MTLGESEFMSTHRPPSRFPRRRHLRGLHRLTEPLGKISGRIPALQGQITEPVYGPPPQHRIEKRRSPPKSWQRGRASRAGKVHGELRPFFRITTSAFCGSCHDVTLFNGFRLEEAFSEYKHSPAVTQRRAVSGLPHGQGTGPPARLERRSGFRADQLRVGPAAKGRGLRDRPRKLTQPHVRWARLFGPAAVAFPASPGRGQDEKEPIRPAAAAWQPFASGRPSITRPAGAPMSSRAMCPPAPPSAALDVGRRSPGGTEDHHGNQALLDEMSRNRLILQRNGYKLGDIVTQKSGPDGITFAVQLRNGTDGMACRPASMSSGSSGSMSPSRTRRAA